MNDLKVRTLWGTMFVAVLIGATWISPYTFSLLFVFISSFTLKEFYDLLAKSGAAPHQKLGILAGIVLFLVSFFVARGALSEAWLLTLIPLMLSLFVAELYRNKSMEMPFRNIAYTAIGVIYISVPFALLNFFVFPRGMGYTYEPKILLSLLFFIWASDSGAYLIGSQFGKHRLFERISPKKSWEGFFGGLAAALIVAAILSQFWDQYSFFPLAIIAAITVVAGTFGDLIESMFKRSLGVKDSGNFMPGHGGLLDRFDSILTAIPMVYFILVFLR